MAVNSKSPEYEDGYCIDCTINHNCTNCPRMNALVKETNAKAIELLPKEEERINQVKICWDCGSSMRESKKKGGARYYCPNCYRK